MGCRAGVGMFTGFGCTGVGICTGFGCKGVGNLPTKQGHGVFFVDTIMAFSHRVLP